MPDKSSMESDIAVLKSDINWLKWVVGIGFTVIGLIHFVDPSNHWWVFVYP